MQAYDRVFASVYNRRWGGFAAGAAPRLESYLAARLGPRARPPALLDLCCGTGQMAAHFLARGWTVDGVDLSPHMIEHARRNNAAAVSAGTARFLVADAAVVDLGHGVDAAVSLYDALNHLPSLDRLAMCLERVRQHLPKGAVFVFDLNTRKGLEQWNGLDVREDDEITLITRGVFGDGMERAYTRISGFAREEDGTWTPFAQTVYNTVFDLAEVRRAALAAGFGSVRATTLDALDTVCPDPESLSRVFFVCETSPDMK